jgi:GMP synthase (glutamine-hydrolysing)
MAYYRTTGYFEPHQYDLIAERVLAASVSGEDLLRRFAERLPATH